MKQIKDMTTAEWREAWTEIAVAFETEQCERTDIQMDAVGGNGLCAAFDFVTHFAYEGINDYPDICYLMQQFAKTKSASDEWFPRGGWHDIWGSFDPAPKWRRKHDILRSTFAAMFAAMTPKEFLEICEAPR